MYSAHKKDNAYDAGSDAGGDDNNITYLTYKKVLENIELEKKAQQPDKFKAGIEFQELLKGD